jgi:hypothetical protein
MGSAVPHALDILAAVARIYGAEVLAGFRARDREREISDVESGEIE